MPIVSELITRLGVQDQQTPGMQKAERAVAAFTATAQKGVDAAADSAKGFAKTNALAAASSQQLAGAQAVATRGLGATTVALGIAAVGAFGLVMAFRSGISAAMETEQQMLTLSAVLNATGNQVALTSGQIDGLARSIANTAGVATNAARSAATALVSLNSVAGETFNRTMRAAADLAAVGFGSVTSAAVMLGRVMQDPLRGIERLREAGISLTAAQRQQIRSFTETGQVAQAQRLILAQLEQQVGGAGAAGSSGLSGAWHRLTQATGTWFGTMAGNIAKTIGLQGAIEKVTEWVTSLNKAMGVTAEANSINPALEAQLNTAVQKLHDLEKSYRTVTEEMAEFRRNMNLTEAQLIQLMPRYASLVAEHNRLVTAIQAARNPLAAELAAIALAYASADAAAREFYQGQDRARANFEGVRDELQKQIEGLRGTELGQRQLEAARRAGVVGMGNEERQIHSLVATIDALTFSRQRLNTTLSGLQTFRESLQTEEQAEHASHGLRTAQLQAFFDARMITAQEHHNMMEQEWFRHQQRLGEIQQSQAQHLISAQMNTGQALVSVLQQMGGKSKAAAVAAIAVNTALQVASAIQNTAAAQTRALAELGPIAGPPVAASIGLWGKAQVGLIVAAGSMQAAGSLSGGSVPSSRGGGSGGESDIGTTNSEPPVQRSIHITLDRGFVSSDQIQELIERINSEVKNGSTLITTSVR